MLLYQRWKFINEYHILCTGGFFVLPKHFYIKSNKHNLRLHCLVKWLIIESVCFTLTEYRYLFKIRKKSVVSELQFLSCLKSIYYNIYYNNICLLKYMSMYVFVCVWGRKKHKQPCIYVCVHSINSKKHLCLDPPACNHLHRASGHICQ